MCFRFTQTRKVTLKLGFGALVVFGSFFWTQNVHAQTTERLNLSLEASIPIRRTLKNPADGISVTLSDPKGMIEAQVLESNVWSEWHLLTPDTDASPYEHTSQLLYTNDATMVRLRSATDTEVTLHSFSVSSEPILRGKLAVAGRELGPIETIITRSQWGADESLRISEGGKAKAMHRIFDTRDPLLNTRIRNCERRAKLYEHEFRSENQRKVNEKGEPLTWSQGYSPEIHLVVLHHTAESSTSAARKSGVERMRALYAYHAIGRSWGDIGYNYAVDPQGNIYEGRAGGPYVVGAHAFCHNVGSVGIALMGNFQGLQPSEAQLRGLRLLLVHLSDLYDLDLASKPLHHGKPTPALVGHRDLRPTACPGVFSHELLPQLRLTAANRDITKPLFSTNTKASTEFEALLLSSEKPITLHMGQRKELKVQLKNKSKEAWRKHSWLLGEGGSGMFFTGILPYSFIAGFLQEDEVKPGEVGTFIAQLQAGLSKIGGSITLTPVINNNRRLLQSAARVPFEILDSSPKFTYVTSYFPPLHKTGEDLTGIIKILNSGTVPWDRSTITELEFSIEDESGRGGDVSILNHPEAIAPGKQGTFEVRFHNVDEEGPYERSIRPHFGDDSPLIGSSILIASRAEPIPEIFHSASPTQLLAQSRTTFSRGRSLLKDDFRIEALDGTNFTLSPKEQIPIRLRIRAGRRGIKKRQTIAPVTRSHPTIILRGEDRQRVVTLWKSPASLRSNKVHDTTLTLIAPKRTGEYTFAIGDISFSLSVTPSGRARVQKSPPRRISRRWLATKETMTQRWERRRNRRLLTKPRIQRQSDSNKDQNIRIRLSYDGSSTIISSPDELHVASDKGAMTVKGSLSLSRQKNFCHVISGNGQMVSSAIRFTPVTINGYTTIHGWGRSANKFRGVVECRVIDGKLTLINELPLETYLAGLAEEPDSEPYEKQRAFAIAARSYALYYMTSGQRKFPEKPYDGSDSPAEFQKYGGLHFEESNPRWTEAVRSTAHKVLTFERKVIKAPYHSRNSGQTRSALEVWGWEHTPYLPSVKDPWCEGMASWGHGVGMSGCGAKGQALEEKMAEEILTHYYPGTRVINWKVLE